MILIELWLNEEIYMYTIRYRLVPLVLCNI